MTSLISKQINKCLALFYQRQSVIFSCNINLKHGQQYSVKSNPQSSKKVGQVKESIQLDKPKDPSMSRQSVRAAILREINLVKLKKDIQKKKDSLHKKRDFEALNYLHYATELNKVIDKKGYQQIERLSGKEKRDLAVLKLEVEFSFSKGDDVLNPEEMTSVDWLEALKIPMQADRLLFYNKLFKKTVEKIAFKEETKRKKEEEMNKRENEMKEKNVPYVEPMHRNTMFLRITRKSMRPANEARQAWSMQYGSPILFDMDYVHEMKGMDIMWTAQQIKMAYIHNLSYTYPWHIHLTNCTEDNATYRATKFDFGTVPFLCTVTPKSYLDMYDKSRLVYLTPHSKANLDEFNPKNDIYIIGCFTDKNTTNPICIARAKKLGIRTAKLPLDKYLHWGAGGKSLLLPLVIDIMSALGETNSWSEAFKKIPEYNLKPIVHNFRKDRK